LSGDAGADLEFLTLQLAGHVGLAFHGGAADFLADKKDDEAAATEIAGTATK
jgi:hypothetical protein